MKQAIVPLFVAVLLAAGGGVAWMLGAAERRTAEGRQALGTLEFDAAMEAPGDQATAQYWLARYDALVQPRDASGTVVQRDPEVLLVAANAAYRALDRSTPDRQGLVRSLDGIIKSYAEVLKRDGAPDDAAYNYEFLVRQRDTIARARAATARAAVESHAAIHGHEGAPPKGTDMSNFRIIIPKQTDERDEELKPGTGEVKRRKG